MVGMYACMSAASLCRSLIWCGLCDRRSFRHLGCDQVPERWARYGRLAACLVPTVAFCCAAQIGACQGLILLCARGYWVSDLGLSGSRGEAKPDGSRQGATRGGVHCGNGL